MKSAASTNLEADCADDCDGMNVTNMRHGDPMVHYRKCPHGQELKRLHRKMSNKNIRADVLATIKRRRF